MDAAVEQLSKTPWCKALIDDPAWKPARNRSHVKEALAQDSFWGGTLGTDKTVRHYLTLKPREEIDEDIAYQEVWSLLEIGSGVSGHPGICHGGFVATILDETLGAFVMSNLVQKERRRRRMGFGPKQKISCFTAYLNTHYKKPVPAPAILLCKAKFEKQDRNKLYVSGTIEDGNGTVFSYGEGMFIEVKTKL